MTTNEIKKALYKVNPIADFTHIKKGVAHYHTHVIGYSEDEDYDFPLQFSIPIADMGDGIFLDRMYAKLLIRWIVKQEDGNDVR